jgi:hypothetical protein
MILFRCSGLNGGLGFIQATARDAPDARATLGVHSMNDPAPL